MHIILQTELLVSKLKKCTASDLDIKQEIDLSLLRLKEALEQQSYKKQQNNRGQVNA